MASKINPSEQRFLDSPAAKIVMAMRPNMSLEEVRATVESAWDAALKANGGRAPGFFDASEEDCLVRIIPVKGEVLSLG